MRQRVGLLAGQDKAALFGAPSRLLSASFTSWRSRSAISSAGAVQALFGLDHVAGGEAILAASVLAKLDQIGRTAHRAHDLVELVDAVAVPVREHRHVAAREGRLLMRDRVQRHRWIGDDPRAVVAGDLAVHVRAVGGLDPFALDPLRGAPIWLCGSSPMPCASRLRWSMRASMSSSASRSLTCSAQRSRQRSTISVRFQSRTFWPNRSRPRCAW
jgi:hypothetical protein